MFSSWAKKIPPVINQFRYLSGGLILDSKLTTKKRALKTIDLKKTTKKRPRKRQILVKKISDDIEAVWLENLNSENLALYRKTSYGSFRKIDSTKLLKRLQEIYPALIENAQATTQTQSKRLNESDSSEIQTSSEEQTIAVEETKAEPPCGSPYMSNYLIEHLMEFPLLKSQCNSPAGAFMQQEHEDFGAIDSQKFPSVSNILTETMSDGAKIRLKLWRERMIGELGAEGFKKYYKDTLLEGTLFHSTLKTYLEVADKGLVKVDPMIEGCWRSLEKFLTELGDVQYVEEPVYHPILLYRGVLDCVASYRGTPYVIEWKKSKKGKFSIEDTFDAPLQLTAYLGALPWHKNVTIKKGLVVVAYTDGSPADVFDMSLESCEVYWMEWLKRVKTYWLKKSSVVVEE